MVGLIGGIVNRSQDVLALEILTNTPAVANVIREGNTPMLLNIIQSGKSLGMQTMDAALAGLIRAGKISQRLAEQRSSTPEELRRQYTLGYYPKTDNVDGNERHQIKVRVRQPNLAVKARDSYVKTPAPSPNK